MAVRIASALVALFVFVTTAPVLGSAPVDRDGIPARVDGVELRSIKGWFANLYPWRYLPDEATVHPVLRFWGPRRFQSMLAVSEQSRVLNDYGAGADVLEYNPNPIYPDHNQWLSTYFATGSRPFFLLYEHINGTRYDPADGPKNMNLALNRAVFRQDVVSMVRNVMLPFRNRYVTHNGRAVIFLWSPVQMQGDFATLLEEMRARYPVIFIGSANLMAIPQDPIVMRNLKALDGFMEYALVSDDYARMAKTYREASARWRRTIDDFARETGRSYLFIPTFQAAFDDTKVQPPRNRPPMYPRNRAEVLSHARGIKAYMGSAYDQLGPFVVFNELAEGAAIIESQCLPETEDTTERYVGCGTARLDIVKEVFAP